jgi:hypothetical protein
MDIEQRLACAHRLARDLSSVDANEVKKFVTFLSRGRSLESLRQLVDLLPSTSFARRSKKTSNYFAQIKRSILADMPLGMDVEDAVWILGWAARLMTYYKRDKERGRQESEGRRSRSGPPQRRGR